MFAEILCFEDQHFYSVIFIWKLLKLKICTFLRRGGLQKTWHNITGRQAIENNM
jgi:hypothetical protein